MIKKILALSVCLMMSASMLSACDSKDTSSSSSEQDSSSGTDNSSVSEDSTDNTYDQEIKLVIDGEEVDTDGLVMCSYAGIDVSFEEFRYYWLFYYDQLASLGYDFENDADDVLSLLKYNTLNDLSNTYAMLGLAKENDLNYLVSEEDLQTAYMYQLMQFESENDYFEFLSERHMTDTTLQLLLSSYLAYENAYDALFAEGGLYYTDNDAVAEIFASDEVARCVHILIPFSACAEISEEDMESWDELSLAAKYNILETAYAQLSESEQQEVAQKSLELAEEVLAKAQAGEDFFSLIEQYNYDPGMEPEEGQSYSDIAGYYFTRDYSYVQEFIDATFDLEENEISPVVTSESFGYHIILRLPVDSEYVQENIDDITAEYNETQSYKIYDEYLSEIEITFSDYFDQLTIDSIS